VPHLCLFGLELPRIRCVRGTSECGSSSTWPCFQSGVLRAVWFVALAATVCLIFMPKLSS
jgi:hypothetical protein